MITGAVIVAVPAAHLLLAMRRADAGIHVEQNASRRTAAMNAVDSLTGKIGERGKVLFGTEPARFETPHLTCRRRTSRGCLAADNPMHRRIMAQPFGVIHILVFRKSPEDRLSQHTDKRVPAILASAEIREPLPSHLRKAECIVEFTIGNQPSIRDNHRTRN